MFLAIAVERTRLDVLDAASKAKFTDEEYELFQKASKAIRVVQSERNSFAHQLWGITDTVPDALLLVDQDYRLSHMMEIDEKMKEWHKNRMKTPIVPFPASVTNLDPSKIKIYR